jgi:homoserine kinase type II
MIERIERDDLPFVAEAFGLGPLRTAAFLPSGLMNLNWKVVGSHRTAAVKVLLDASAKSPERALEVVALLADEGVPVAGPLLADDQVVIEVGGLRYCALSWVEGEQPAGADLTLAQAGQLGAMLGRIHAVLGPIAAKAGLDGPDGPPRAKVPEVADTLERGRRYLELIADRAEPEEFDHCAVAALRAQRALIERFADQRPSGGVLPGPFGWTHGDFQPLNLLWERDGALAAVLDWDRLGVRSFGEELVRSGNYLFPTPDGRGLDLKRIAAFASGYRSTSSVLTSQHARDAAERMWWRRLTDTWILEFHYDRDDRSCDHLYDTSCRVLEWWTVRRDEVAEAFAAGA